MYHQAMLRCATFLFWLAGPGLLWAQPGFDTSTEARTPMRTQAAFSGTFLTNDTEFLTPGGILDTLPPQPALIPLETLEPAAGPETSPTEFPPGPLTPAY
jgi:hypothetical protein